MNTKPLYILISDNFDGSFSTQFTFNTELINKLQVAYDADLMDYENGIACDGDGFHYTTLNVPFECTAESLGLNKYQVLADDFADRFER